MIRWSGYSFTLLGVLHMFVLGNDALPAIAGWLQGKLWTLEHTVKPPDERSAQLVLSTDAFWSTVGSLGVPLVLVGSLIVWLDARDYPIPRFLGWALGAWLLVASLIMEPSGFPLGVVIAGFLIVGVSRAEAKQ